jgi:transcriptional regulator with XRE-family HTH domain
MVRDLGRELRRARVEHSLSQESVGQAAGLSDTEVGQIERGLIRTVSVVQLSRLLGVVGLELSARAHPAGSPIRDGPQLLLLGRLRAEISAQIAWDAEVPVGTPGDLRTWDAVLRVAGERIGVEAETRLVDLQSVQRRIALKCRDSTIAKATTLADALVVSRRAVQENLQSGSTPVGCLRSMQGFGDRDAREVANIHLMQVGQDRLRHPSSEEDDRAACWSPTFAQRFKGVATDNRERIAD